MEKWWNFSLFGTLTSSVSGDLICNKDDFLLSLFFTLPIQRRVGSPTGPLRGMKHCHPFSSLHFDLLKFHYVGPPLSAVDLVHWLLLVIPFSDWWNDWTVMKTELIHFILVGLKPENKSNFLLWEGEVGTKDFDQCLKVT